MASGALSAHGTKFLIGSSLTGSTAAGFGYTEVADLKDISGPTESNTFIDITNHSSSAIERLASLNDPGTVSLTFSFQPDAATHGSGSSGLIGLLRAQTKRGFRIKWPTTGTEVSDFDGYVSSLDVSAPTADELVGTCEIQITGSITSSTST